jgi:hypothetical protein
MRRKKKAMAKRKSKMNRIRERMMEMGESRRTTRTIIVRGPFVCWVPSYEQSGFCSVLVKQWP